MQTVRLIFYIFVLPLRPSSKAEVYLYSMVLVFLQVLLFSSLVQISTSRKMLSLHSLLATTNGSVLCRLPSPLISNAFSCVNKALENGTATFSCTALKKPGSKHYLLQYPNLPYGVILFLPDETIFPCVMKCTLFLSLSHNAILYFDNCSS